ncbi:MAG: flagellar biosynthesis anti-sigma factor FlgM [Thiobacillus sp.]|uniref:flagellar biosynthesis anti-sigma factor FlgM n=1 Tax=Thiobacillus sp. TaxID=924 RepID=UPI002735CB66|nr:flagellar biosynthesis anti-sigma factor FlgM [Thiobacillus sp.]MDP3420399.1 flagellar biosynthesis anti-sigma factor FlgM [Thiobacillus sp.]MDP3583677.1 flagellar biosynthesis anti-sigma factor FlgM [Thiobacillus sp.]
MKIDKRITPPAASKVSATKGKGGGKAPASSAGGSDSLTLTESSTRVRSLEAELASVDVTNLGKVESVKAALADGSFSVDAEVVADRLIDHTKETLRKRPRKK